jgi:C-terminal processing protease CtpA/Prc
MKMFKIFCCVLFTIAMGFNAIRAQELKLTYDAKKRMISDICELLVEHYVFEDVARNCVQKLDSAMGKGEYDSIISKEQFAIRLTQDLQGMSRDKHLEVQVEEEMSHMNSRDTALESINKLRAARQKSNYSFRKVEIINGNIGYLDFRSFSPAEMAMAKASAAMKFLSDCDALIIDMRENTGGNPDLIAYICSYFFEKPTLLNKIYYRKANRTLEFWTREVNDVRTLYDTPMFVLTSGTTISASEEFAYDLQSRKRAIVVGEITAGGANIASGFRLNGSFVIYIPRGRAINPITHENWEGVGVRPDVSVASGKALEKAIEIATVEAKKYRGKKEDEYRSMIRRLEIQMAKTDEKNENGYDHNEEDQLVHLLREAKSSGLIDESSLTFLGYDYLHQNRTLLSITVFKYCVKMYPDSYNAYDSLGEAYMVAGQKELAIENYEKSLKLNPKNKNAVEQLKKLREK